jgi:hypothetical protein
MAVPLFAAWLAVLATQPACFPEQCIRKTTLLRDVPLPEGALIDANTWESSADGGDWLEFDGARQWLFFPPFEARQLDSVQVYLSASRQAIDENGFTRGFALATGSLAEVAYTPATKPGEVARLFVTNGTCAKYYMRVVLKAKP